MHTFHYQWITLSRVWICVDVCACAFASFFSFLSFVFFWHRHPLLPYLFLVVLLFVVLIFVVLLVAISYTHPGSDQIVSLGVRLFAQCYS